MKRTEVCKKALEYLNTPYKHQGRLKGVGVDCAGLIYCLAKECNLYKGNIKDKDVFGYARIPDGVNLHKTLKNGTAKEKTIEELKIGDILLISFLKLPHHIALYMPDNKIIHSYNGVDKVVLHNFDEKWKRRVVSVFEFENIED